MDYFPLSSSLSKAGITANIAWGYIVEKMALLKLNRDKQNLSEVSRYQKLL